MGTKHFNYGGIDTRHMFVLHDRMELSYLGNEIIGGSTFGMPTSCNIHNDPLFDFKQEVKRY